MIRTSPEQSRRGLEALTPREIEILERIADGATNADAAAALGISPRTVQTHVANAFQKLGVRTRAAAIAQFVRSTALALAAAITLQHWWSALSSCSCS